MSTGGDVRDPRDIVFTEADVEALYHAFTVACAFEPSGPRIDNEQHPLKVLARKIERLRALTTEREPEEHVEPWWLLELFTPRDAVFLRDMAGEDRSVESRKLRWIASCIERYVHHFARSTPEEAETKIEGYGVIRNNPGESAEVLATRREDGRGDSPEGGTAPDKAGTRADSPTILDQRFLDQLSALERIGYTLTRREHVEELARLRASPSEEADCIVSVAEGVWACETHNRSTAVPARLSTHEREETT